MIYNAFCSRFSKKIFLQKQEQNRRKMRAISFIWRFPTETLKLCVFQLNLEPTATAEAMRRRRPLHTCTASCLAILHNACIMAQDLGGPFGSTARNAATFFDSYFSFVYTLLYQWLSLLSIMDDQILTVESKVEIIFPPCKRLFDKMDAVVCRAEALPEQLDELLVKLPSLMHQCPLLDRIVVRLVSLWSFVFSIRERKEKDDAEGKEGSFESECCSESEETSKKEGTNGKSYTYKEVLEKGKKKDREMRDHKNRLLENLVWGTSEIWF